MIQKDEARNFAENQNILFQEVSAITNTNVNNTFEILIEEIYKKKGNNDVINLDKTIELNGKPKEKKGCC